MVKICTVGTPNSGINKFIRRYTTNTFGEDYLPTLGVDITTHRIRTKNCQIKAIFLDLDCSEKFGNIRKSYYDGTIGIFLFFTFRWKIEGCDLDQVSWDAIPRLFNELPKTLPKSVPITLVGLFSYSSLISKIKDKITWISMKTRKLPYHRYKEGRAFAQKNDLMYVELEKSDVRSFDRRVNQIIEGTFPECY
jgi:GTPase SAR1 family protein